MDSALRVLEMLGAACLAAGGYQEASIVAGEGELGLGTGSGERPHAQVSGGAGAADRLVVRGQYAGYLGPCPAASVAFWLSCSSP